jgi:hypothetical protein
LCIYDIIKISLLVSVHYFSLVAEWRYLMLKRGIWARVSA